MRRTSITALLLATTLIALADPKPNVLFIYGDDVGYGDVGVYGAEKIPTPNIGRPPTVYIENGRVVNPDPDDPITVVREAENFLRSQQRDRPFFLLFSANNIHAPRWPHERFRGVGDRGPRGDATVSFDWSTGALPDLPDELGLAENTLVVFSSDKGPTHLHGGHLDGSTVEKQSRHPPRQMKIHFRSARTLRPLARSRRT